MNYKLFNMWFYELQKARLSNFISVEKILDKILCEVNNNKKIDIPIKISSTSNSRKRRGFKFKLKLFFIKIRVNNIAKNLDYPDICLISLARVSPPVYLEIEEWLNLYTKRYKILENKKEKENNSLKVIFLPVLYDEEWSEYAVKNQDKILVIDGFFLFQLIISNPIKFINRFSNILKYSHIPNKISRNWLRSAISFSIINLLCEIINPSEILLTASNSNFYELIRFWGLEKKIKVREILHGVMCKPFIQYHKWIFEKFGRTTEFSVCLPRVNNSLNFNNLMNFETINITFNKLDLELNSKDISTHDYLIKKADELKIKSNDLVITIIGGNDHAIDLSKSVTLAYEIQLIYFLIKSVETTKKKIIYSPHPLRSNKIKRYFSDIGISNSVLLTTDTLSSLFFSDFAYGIFSSSIFEAAELGVKVFTPMQKVNPLFGLDDMANLICTEDIGGINGSISIINRFFKNKTEELFMDRACKRLEKIVNAV